MKRRFSDGRQTLRFTPRELLLRLCALVPPRGMHMVRYHGGYASLCCLSSDAGQGERLFVGENGSVPRATLADAPHPEPDAVAVQLGG